MDEPTRLSAGVRSAAPYMVMSHIYRVLVAAGSFSAAPGDSRSTNPGRCASDPTASMRVMRPLLGFPDAVSIPAAILEHVKLGVGSIESC